MKSFSINICLAIFTLLMLLPTQALSPEFQTNELPEGILVPWHTVGIVSESAKQAQSALDESFKYLDQSWLDSSQTLTEYVTNQTVTNNERFVSNKIKVGPLKTGKKNKSLLLEPIWTSVGDQYIFILQVIDASLDTLIISTHQVVSKNEDWTKATKEKKLNGLINEIVQNLFSEVTQKLSSYEFKEPTTALHIGFNLTKESTRPDTGSNFALNLLLAEKLLSTNDFTITRNVDDETFQNLRALIKSQTKIRRSTRVISTNWTIQHPNYKIDPKFPLKYSLTATFSESVFGTRIGKPISANYELSIVDKKVDFKVDDQTVAFLQGEAKSLSLIDEPQVAKVYGAWVYLDRGRAYGLKMNDRLVSSDGKEMIKGHIVGFYGPGLNIDSPRGYKISEGAIVYIRKGQRQTRIGQVFQYDQTQYPTTWPPTK
jgi:hypothetical protein